MLVALEDTQEVVAAGDPQPDADTSARAGREGAKEKTLRRWRMGGGLIGPTVIFLVLHVSGFPMPDTMAALLGGFCALLLVAGVFWLVYPEPDVFLQRLLPGLKEILGFFAARTASASPAEDAESATAAGGPDEGSGPREA
uniref:hypothetical protein n=1 Tax=Paractinoplanes polyasparticus TaxID=2856853 RepID=UPI001C84661C|nr:hypothetical protein [Actinoplanes polyasparticus]